MSFSRATGAMDIEGIAFAVVEGFYGGGDFKNGIANGGQAVFSVGMGKELRFDEPGAVRKGNEFHGLTITMIDHPIDDDQTATGDLDADMAVKICDGTIGFPGNIGIAVEGVPADGEPEEFIFRIETFLVGRLGEGVGRGRVMDRILKEGGGAFWGGSGKPLNPPEKGGSTGA